MSLVFFNESLQTFGANRGAPDYSALIGRVRICFDLTMSEHSYYASAKEFASGTSHDNRQRLGTIYITFHKMLLQSQMDSIHDTVEFPVVMFLVWGEWGGGGEGGKGRRSTRQRLICPPDTISRVSPPFE